MCECVCAHLNDKVVWGMRALIQVASGVCMWMRERYACDCLSSRRGVFVCLCVRVCVCVCACVRVCEHAIKNLNSGAIVFA